MAVAIGRADLNQGLKSRALTEVPGREETGRDRAGRWPGGEAGECPPGCRIQRSKSSAGQQGWEPVGRPWPRAAGLRRLDLKITARFKDHR